MRVVQPVGQRGSLKWIQRAVAERWSELEQPIEAGGVTGPIEWLSPLAEDGFAEYRDAAFLARLGLENLTDRLAVFWPQRGPQWDALGRTSAGDVILVEAKAHIGEFCTAGTSAGPASRARIDAQLRQVAATLGSRAAERWCNLFYQYANRLAHLHFLRAAAVDAYLVLVGFLDDAEMRGPTSPEAWLAAYRVADHVLDLPARHPLARYVIHAFPSVARHG